MEPKLPSPEMTPESPANVGEFPAQSPEHEEYGQAERRPETGSVERAGEQHHAVTTTPTPITLPTPVPVQSDGDDNDATTVTDDNPTTASDDDLIEKEWVDKAKRIITDTKEDPHLREKQVGQLQADYLKKRYGKELGEAT